MDFERENLDQVPIDKKFMVSGLDLSGEEFFSTYLEVFGS